MFDPNDIVAMLRRVAPKARPEYLEAFRKGGALLEIHGITNAERLAAFLANVMVESGALKVTFENLNYTTFEVLKRTFGKGHHTAALTDAECRALLGRPRDLAERVYGLGNPKKARELGNTQPGDGYRCRGGGPMQTTGGANYRRMSARCGVDFYANPDLLVSAEHALKPALFEWSDGDLNRYADAGDFLATAKAINLGSPRAKKMPNGWADRLAWYKRLLPLCRQLRRIDPIDAIPQGFADLPAEDPAAVDRDRDFDVTVDAANDDRAPAAPDSRLASAQRLLRERGYFEVGAVTGIGGPRTDAAVRAFRADHKLPDGTEIDDDLLAALADPANDRAVAPERALATADDLREQGSKTLSLSDWGKKIAGGLFGVSAVGAAGDGASVIETATDGATKVSAFKSAMDGLGIGIGAVIVLALVALAVWFVFHKIEQHRVADYRAGKNP